MTEHDRTIQQLQKKLSSQRRLNWILGISLAVCLIVLGIIFLINRISTENVGELVAAFFDVISLTASIVSVVLAVIAIWITFHFKSESDKINHITEQVLLDIRTDAKSISSMVIPELEKYGVTSRQILEDASKHKASVENLNTLLKIQELIEQVKNQEAS